MSTNEPLARLHALGLHLPKTVPPIANFLPWRRDGSTVYVSGQIPLENGVPQFVGRVGSDLTREEGYEAARLAALNAVAQLAASVDGDLGRVRRILKLSGFVCATDDFTEHPFVVNGASDLMVAVFGDPGRHARFAVGVTSLPRGVAVEVDLVAAIDPAAREPGI